MKIKIPHNTFILIGILVLLNLVFHPPLMPKRYNIKEGEIAMMDVIAPYDFFIYKTEEELQKKRNEISRRIPPIYNLDNSIPKQVNQMIKGLAGLIDSLVKTKSRDSLIYLVQREYPIPQSALEYLCKNNHNRILKKIVQGIDRIYYLKNGILDKKLETHRILTVVHGDKEIILSSEEVLTVAEAESILCANESKEFQYLVKNFIIPNIIFDESKTEQRIDELFSNVPRIKTKVLKGEIIIEKHKRVSREALDKLLALEKTFKGTGGWEFVKALLFQNLFYLLIILSLVYFDRLNRLNLFSGNNIYFIALLSGIYIIVGKVLYTMNLIYLLPISFFVILFAQYFNTSTAFIFTAIFALLFGIILNSMPVFLYLFGSGMAACFSSPSIKTRLSLYRLMIYIGVVNIFIILFIEV